MVNDNFDENREWELIFLGELSPRNRGNWVTDYHPELKISLYF